MTKASKKLLGLLSFVPIVLWLLNLPVAPFIPVEAPPDRLFTTMDLFPGLWGKVTLAAGVLGFLAALLLGISSFMGYRVPKDRRLFWGIVLIFGSLFALPFYWWFRVWRAPSQ